MIIINLKKIDDKNYKVIEEPSNTIILPKQVIYQDYYHQNGMQLRKARE
jgi:hypothetical protein